MPGNDRQNGMHMINMKPYAQRLDPRLMSAKEGRVHTGYTQMSRLILSHSPWPIIWKHNDLRESETLFTCYVNFISCNDGAV